MKIKFNVLLITMCVLFFNSEIVLANSISLFTPVNLQVDTREYMSEINERKKVIRENNTKIETLKVQITERSSQLDKAIISLLNYGIELDGQAEKNLDKIMDTIIKNIIKVSNIQNKIAKQIKDANENIKSENYETSINLLDKAITLQDKECVELENTISYLHSSIEFIKNLSR